MSIQVDDDGTTVESESNDEDVIEAVLEGVKDAMDSSMDSDLQEQILDGNSNVTLHLKATNEEVEVDVTQEEEEEMENGYIDNFVDAIIENCEGSENCKVVKNATIHVEKDGHATIIQDWEVETSEEGEMTESEAEQLEEAMEEAFGGTHYHDEEVMDEDFIFEGGNFTLDMTKIEDGKVVHVHHSKGNSTSDALDAIFDALEEVSDLAKDAIDAVEEAAEDPEKQGEIHLMDGSKVEVSVCTGGDKMELDLHGEEILHELFDADKNEAEVTIHVNEKGASKVRNSK